MPAPRVVVAGGSLGGLTAALVLRDAGCDVQVYERSRVPLDSRGAGIVLHAATVRYLLVHDLLDLEQISTAVRVHRTLWGDGSLAHEEPTSYRFTAWNTLYGALLKGFDQDRYHLGEALVGMDQDPAGVSVRFAGGREERCELLVCADGIASTGRRRLLPGVEPEYAGYVGWRGTVPEADLTPAAREALGEALTYVVLPGSHVLVYPIPDTNGAAGVGERLLNFVWYRNVAAGAELDELMTDRDGNPRPTSVPPGAVQERYVSALRAAAGELLPQAVAEVVVRTRDPFLQPIVDLGVPRMAFGRACLIGDAAFAARPHAAAGTAKAAADAWALADAVRAAGGDMPGALARWEPGQLALGRQLLARVADMGRRSQFAGTWAPGDPSLAFGLRVPGDSHFTATKALHF
jgi:2,6-dihydroxypyridine 3-monooxygenase